MRLAFLAGGSVNDRLGWSGTNYYAHRALAKRFDLATIEMPGLSFALRGLRKLMRPTGVDPLREALCGSAFAARAASLIAKARADAVFVLGASHIGAGLTDRFPVFHCSDTTFKIMLGYHGEFVGLSRRTVWAGNELERRIIQNSAGVILASEAAARSVRADYGRTDGVYVVPFGANLDELPAADVWQRSDECTLVFIGVQWLSKGADVAVDACRILNERGIRTVLHVVGCSPPPDLPPMPFVKFHGFLRKQIPEEYARLTELVAHADFLILPTRFEAYGIVFCEAAAHGTPSVARATGGVPTIIQDGVTGALLPVEAGPDAYADRMQEIWCDPDRYQEMRRRAFLRSRTTLNWDSWAERVEAIIQERLAPRSSPSAISA